MSHRASLLKGLVLAVDQTNGLTTNLMILMTTHRETGAKDLWSSSVEMHSVPCAGNRVLKVVKSFLTILVRLVNGQRYQRVFEMTKLKSTYVIGPLMSMVLAQWNSAVCGIQCALGSGVNRL